MITLAIVLAILIGLARMIFTAHIATLFGVAAVIVFALAMWKSNV